MNLPFTLFLTALISTLSFSISAQERTLDIQFEQIDELTVEASIVAYTRTQIVTDGDKVIFLCWGDDECEEIWISNGIDADGGGILDGEQLNEYYTKFLYTATHTYASPGAYNIYCQNSGRGWGVLNVYFPNSVSIPIYVEAEVQLNEFSDDNHSPVLLEAPIDFGYLNLPYIHMINAFDQDDDSLHYEIITPLSDAGEPVPQYWDLSNTEGSPEFDPETGVFYWENPPLAGPYTFAFVITSYRNGQIQDRVMRDMTIYIDDPGDGGEWPSISMDTPEAMVQEVAVGDTVLVHLESTDTPGQTVTFSSTSGLYDYFAEPALFSQVSGNPATATFEWIVREEHARVNPYPVVFSATDDDEDGAYTNSKLVRYRVMGLPTHTLQPTAEHLTLRIFPNPSTGWVQVQWPAEGPSFLDYQLSDAQGRLLQSGWLDQQTNTLNLQHLPTGCYWLQVNDGLSIKSSPIILLDR